MAGVISFSRRALDRIYAVPELIPDWAFQLFARVAVAPVFWFSGRAKVSHCDFFDVMALRYVWDEGSRCAARGDDFWTSLIIYAEHLLPVLLIVGLATRFSALALFIMTIILHFILQPHDWWSTPLLWVFALLFTLAHGAGPASLDHVINKVFKGR